MIVYKYRANSETTESIFTNKTVWLSTPAALNDPFEADIVFSENYPESVENMKEKQVEAFLKDANNHRRTGTPFYGLDRKETFTLIQRFRNLHDKNLTYQNYSNFIEQKTGLPPLNPGESYHYIPGQLSSIGIFSLSETPDNSLMWAHYGENHNGICIGFEVTDDSLLNNSEHCLHVKYSNDTPKIDDVIEMERQMATLVRKGERSQGSIALSHPIIQSTIATKGLEWNYEREWRYVEFTAGEYSWPAPVVEITFGLRCSKVQRNHYINLIKCNVPNDVRLYEIIKIPGTKLIKRVLLDIASSDDLDDSLAPNIHVIQQLMHRKRFISALKVIDSLLEVQPRNAEAWRCKGIALGWSEDHSGAIECFTKGITIEPDNFSLHYQMGVAHSLLGRHEESLGAFKTAQDLCPWEPSFPYNLGLTLVHLNRPTEALVQFEKANSLGHQRAEDQIVRLNESYDNQAMYKDQAENTPIV